jgi:type II secretory pathway component PulF
VSFEVVLSRVAGMSAAGLWAVAAILVIIFLGAWLISRLRLSKRREGERFRLKMPFFEIETGPPTDDPTEPRPPSKDEQPQ